ncbi:uncharacterized protein LOC116336643 [Contarinia nasturtii]|uniref:uncharacterized protein LOC116336643 n=1 Tax=Contarinia nasturtii TaxID=265458 RepID=UPI0012D44714|nr:uncharacterized protein LOC116336643 [Contarinia nasturtii]
MAKLTEIINSPHSTNLLKSKQNPQSTSVACNSKLPDVNAESDSLNFTVHLKTDTEQIQPTSLEISQLDEAKTSNINQESSTESALKCELAHVRKLLDEEKKQSNRLAQENEILKKFLEEKIMDGDTESNSSTNEDAYDDHIFELNEQILELKDITQSYLADIHELEEGLKEQIYIRDENVAEIHHLRQELAQQVQKYQDLKSQFDESYLSTHSIRSYSPKRVRFLESSSCDSPLTEKVNNLKRSAIAFGMPFSKSTKRQRNSK